MYNIIIVNLKILYQVLIYIMANNLLSSNARTAEWTNVYCKSVNTNEIDINGDIVAENGQFTGLLQGNVLRANDDFSILNKDAIEVTYAVGAVGPEVATYLTGYIDITANIAWVPDTAGEMELTITNANIGVNSMLFGCVGTQTQALFNESKYIVMCQGSSAIGSMTIRFQNSKTGVNIGGAGELFRFHYMIV